MRIIETQVFSFEELNEDAKEKAINNFRETNYLYEYPWQDEGYQSLKDFCSTMDIKLNSAYYSQYSDVDYSTSKIDDDILILKGKRLVAYIHNNFYSLLFEPKRYFKNGSIWDKKNKVRKSRIQKVQTSCPFTGYCLDDDLLQPFREYGKSIPLSVDFEDLLAMCISEWEKSVSSEVEYLLSDEFITTELIELDYEFTEDGELV
jgi:hypothetical protein